MRSAFIISLDFELHWGVRDHLSIDRYRRNLEGTRGAIERMLHLFREHEVHATWAAVGMLFCNGRSDLFSVAPMMRPHYRNRSLDPYVEAERAGPSEAEDPFHFAPSVLERILEVPHQEIATHTFSHYYCLEQGQSDAALRADLEAACRVAKRLGIEISSIVWPRNQLDPRQLPICASLGIRYYRGNRGHPLYVERSSSGERAWRRAGRLVDAYLPLSDSDTVKPVLDSDTGMVNVPASRFLRPYSPRLARFDVVRLRRILAEMRRTAEEGGVYHLWWHPHNFGVHLEENMAFLSAIIKHLDALRAAYGMESMSMQEVGAISATRAAA